KQFIDDKYSRLDIKAETNNNEIINIEIQLKNEYNMIKRSLYYLSKMYEEQLGEGEDYSKLNRTVCINILNFKYLKTEKFHTGYRLKELETNEELTDVIEMHFIEIPKLPEESDEKDILMAWTEFLRDPESEKVRSIEMSIEEIREAKDELIRLSNDESQRELYEMRSKILKDKVSALNEAERKGIEKGRKEGIEKGRKEGIEKGIKQRNIEIAKNLLDVLDDETISLKTGLTIEKIQQLRKEN
uniref:Rpn family recombination-promoting nuclease/putative transposase n=1 Tax=uncultured Clostridium sp. TaxID=59620 RepID=UPI0025E09C36